MEHWSNSSSRGLSEVLGDGRALGSNCFTTGDWLGSLGAMLKITQGGMQQLCATQSLYSVPWLQPSVKSDMTLYFISPWHEAAEGQTNQPVWPWTRPMPKKKPGDSANQGESTVLASRTSPKKSPQLLYATRSGWSFTSKMILSWSNRVGSVTQCSACHTTTMHLLGTILARG